MDKLEHQVSDWRANGSNGALQIDVSGWLKNLTKTYTTAEQHQVHTGGDTRVKSAEITFF
jgi:hypothetical protein